MKQVWDWGVNFTQVGGFVQARDDDNKFFKVVWLLCFLFGMGYTIHSISFLISDYLNYDVITTVRNTPALLLDFPQVAICNANRVHCLHLHNMIQRCEKVSFIFFVWRGFYDFQPIE